MIIQLDTERLELALLTPQQLQWWVSDIPRLENDLGCSYQAEAMEGVFLNIVKNQAELTKNDPNNYVWHSFWFLIRKEDRAVVGSADFKNLPDENGQVEIGYGLGKKFEHMGYMTEAVAAMCRWASAQKNVSAVIAQTDVDGLASQNILKRCGFVQYKKADTLWWRL